MGATWPSAFATARARSSRRSTTRCGQKLSKLMSEGPEIDLTLTENAQPALMAVSLAVMRVLEKDGVSCRDTARVRRRPFARRIFGAGRGRRASAWPTPRAC